MLKMGEKLSRNRNEEEKGEEANAGSTEMCSQVLVTLRLLRRIKHNCCSVVLQQLCCLQPNRNESWSHREENRVAGAAGRSFELDLEPG